MPVAYELLARKGAGQRLQLLGLVCGERQASPWIGDARGVAEHHPARHLMLPEAHHVSEHPRPQIALPQVGGNRQPVGTSADDRYVVVNVADR
jgi:hypothetical protein